MRRTDAVAVVTGTVLGVSLFAATMDTRSSALTAAVAPLPSDALAILWADYCGRVEDTRCTLPTPSPTATGTIVGIDWYTIRTADGITHSHADYRGHPDACPHPHGQPDPDTDRTASGVVHRSRGRRAADEWQGMGRPHDLGRQDCE